MAKSLTAAITSFPKELAKFAVEARDELKKVTWPTRPTTINYTVVVVVVSLAIGTLIGGIDWLLSRLLTLVI
jgi:preprotein translocase subunit SecE